MHKQLILEQRHYIYTTRKKGQSMRSIDTELGITHSTISRELKVLLSFLWAKAKQCSTMWYKYIFYGDFQMKDIALFTQLLGLSDPWRSTAITPNLTDKSITIQIAIGQRERKARVVPAMPFVRFTTTVSGAHGDTLIRCNSRRAWSLRFRVFIVKSMELKACKYRGQIRRHALRIYLSVSLLMCCRLVATKHRPQNYLACRGMRHIIFNPER